MSYSHYEDYYSTNNNLDDSKQYYTNSNSCYYNSYNYPYYESYYNHHQHHYQQIQPAYTNQSIYTNQYYWPDRDTTNLAFIHPNKIDPTLHQYNTLSSNDSIYNNNNNNENYNSTVNTPTTTSSTGTSIDTPTSSCIEETQNSNFLLVHQKNSTTTTTNLTPKLPNKSKKKFKIYENLKCLVCGDSSSGHHYGVYCCEACKLFFRRIAKNKRKKLINECKEKNCYLNPESKSLCAECRYRKCIAVGMSLDRSRFGRHDLTSKNKKIKLEQEFNTNSSLEINQYQSPNIANSIYTLHKDLILSKIKFTFYNYQNKDQNFTIYCIRDFYEKSRDLIKNLNDYAHQYKFLSSNSIMLSKNQELLLVAYLALFDIDLFDNSSSRYTHMYYRIKQLTHQLKTEQSQLVYSNKLNMNLKIITYLYLIQQINDHSDDFLIKRLIDLINSELVCFHVTNKQSVANSQLNSYYMNWLTQLIALVYSYAQF